MLTMHCLTDDVESHPLPQGVEQGSLQIKFLSNSKQSAEINLHTGSNSDSSHQNSSQTQRCKSIFVSSLIFKKGLSVLAVKRNNNFIKILNTADTFVSWRMMIQNNNNNEISSI